MSRSRTITTGWTHPETEEEFRVTMEYEPGSDGGWEEAPSGPEIRVLRVVEDKPGGVSRPDLIDLVDAELDGRYGDDVSCEIGDYERDAYAAAMEDRADALRERAREDSARDVIWDSVRFMAGGRNV